MGFVRSNPIKLGLGSGILMIAAFLLVQGTLGTAQSNPDYYVLNNEKQFLEVYSGNNQFLWSVPWGHSINLTAPGRRSQMSPAFVVDLQGDGTNEVVAAISHLGGVDVDAANVRVFAADGRLLWEKVFNESIRFGEQNYPPSYFVRGLVVGDFDADGKKEIIVNIPHRHSPQLLVRFDHDGREIGRYAHFGHFFDLELIDLDGDGKQELIASGIDDVDSAASIAVLDPSRIVGALESQVTRGFGFKVSDAEQQYVKLPRNEFDVRLFRKPRVFGVLSIGENTISFSAGSSYPVPENGSAYSLDYLFTKDMRLREVTPTDAARRTYERLRQEGKFRAKLDEAFLRGLEERVLYWDGKGWENGVKNITKVGEKTER
jgi:hypothetical protein